MDFQLAGSGQWAPAPQARAVEFAAGKSGSTCLGAWLDFMLVLGRRSPAKQPHWLGPGGGRALCGYPTKLSHTNTPCHPTPTGSRLKPKPGVKRQRRDKPVLMLKPMFVHVCVPMHVCVLCCVLCHALSDILTQVWRMVDAGRAKGVTCMHRSAGHHLGFDAQQHAVRMMGAWGAWNLRCVHTHTHTHTCKHARAHTHTHMQACMRTCATHLRLVSACGCASGTAGRHRVSPPLATLSCCVACCVGLRPGLVV